MVFLICFTLVNYPCLKAKELSDRIHECSLCGLVMNRDLNASKNILRIGMDSLRDRDIPIEAPTPLG
jgi:transposase